MEYKDKIRTLKEEFDDKINQVEDLKTLNDLRITYLGKKGPIQEISKIMGNLNHDERKELGQALNELRSYMTNKGDSLKEELEAIAMERKMQSEEIDVTLPGTNILSGSKHPLTKIVEEVEALFSSMGYDVVTGPDIESDQYNFEMLNVPKDHPARDSQDSFYITEEVLLRTQTSASQVRTMLANADKGDIRIISPGKVYRRDDDDATHSHQFMQIEGLVVGKNISMAHLKGTLEVFAKKMFGEDRKIRFRPSYFPFTEPSFEVDVDCFKCEGNGCPICKNTGWIEILGSGMVHPNVLRMSGYDPSEWTGFAFGMGVERIAMLKYGINDIRDFYTNDLRFLKQFNRWEGDDINESK